jgi:hemerythrin
VGEDFASMALLEWTDKMSVGVPALDADHRKLLGLVNELHAVVRKKESPTVVSRVLRDLVGYADYHFQAEEQLLRLARYPGLEEHKATHEDLRRKVRDLEARYGDKPEKAGLAMFDFLSDWLMRHILGEDMKYKKVLADRAAAKGGPRPPAS